MEKSESGKSKTRKSVAFVGRTGPLDSTSMTESASQLGAAEEGAAIAKKLVERQNALQKGDRGFNFFGSLGGHGGSEGSVDLGDSRQSGQTGRAGFRDGELRIGGRRSEAGKNSQIWGSSTTTLVNIVPKPGQHLPLDDENDSNIDDDEPGSWP